MAPYNRVCPEIDGCKTTEACDIAGCRFLGPEISPATRIAALERELASANAHLHAAYEAAGHSTTSSEPLSCAIDRIRAALAGKEAEVRRLRKALIEADGCFDAALAEGLAERLEEQRNGEPASLAGLFDRRVMFAMHAIRSALSQEPGR